MKKYNELSEIQKEEAKKLHPIDFEKWVYQTQGVEIAFSAK